MFASNSTHSLLTDLLLQEVPTLRREQITLQAELFKDLGLDSIAMVNVMVAFEDRVGTSIDLLPWYSAAKASGNYTLQSIVDFVERTSADSRGEPSVARAVSC